MLLPAPLPWLYPQLGYRADPALIFAMAPNQRGYSADKEVMINERGLRGPVVPYDRTPGTAAHSLPRRLDHVRLRRERRRGGDRTGAHPARRPRARDRGHQQRGAVLQHAAGGHVSRDRRAAVRSRLGRSSASAGTTSTTSRRCGSTPRVDSSTTPTRRSAASAQMRESPVSYAVRNLLKRSRLLYGALEGWRATVGPTATRRRTTTFRTDVSTGADYAAGRPTDGTT